MKKISIVLASLFLLVAFGNRAQAQCTDGATNCYIVIEGHDSYGDGWNGNSMTITQNGTTIGNFTLTSGSLLIDTFRVCTDNGPLSLSWTQGSYPGEVSFTIIDSLGSLIYTLNGAGGLSGVFAEVAPCPTCPGVDNIMVTPTSTTAVATWNELGDATEWLYLISIYSTPAATDVWQTVTATTATLTGLNPNTQYYLFVRSNCGEGDTSLSNSTSFRTECGLQQLPIVEGFENNGTSIPNCWQEWETFDYYYYGNYHYPDCYNYSYYAHSGDYAMRMVTRRSSYGEGPMTGANSVISPVMPVPANQVEVVLWMAGNDELQVGYVTTTDSATAVFHLVGTAGPTTESSYPSSSDYQQFIISFDTVTTTDSIYVVLRRAPVMSTSTIYIDDVTIRQIINCPIPTNVAEAFNVAPVSGQVTLTWNDNGASAWQVAYGPAGFNPDTATTIVNASSNTFAVTGLADSLYYEFYVRAVCGSQNGYWSSPLSGVLPNVYKVTATVDTVTSCGVNIVDNGGINGKMIPGSEQIIVLMPVDDQHSIRLKGLAEFYGDSYYGYNYLRIYAGADTTGTLLLSLTNSDNSNVDVYSEVGPMTIYAAASTSSYEYYIPDGFLFNISCGDRLTCTTPYGFEVSNIHGSGASLSWQYDTAMGPAEGFTVYVDEVDGDFSTSYELDGAARSFTLTGLDERTNYRVRLALDCPGIDTLSATFTTPCVVGGELQIGEGNSTDNYLPAYSYPMSSLSQQIFTASELEETTTITGFSICKASGSNGTQHWKVYIDTTDRESYTSYSDYQVPSNSNLYFDGIVAFEDEWTNILFDSAFTVPENKNIVLTVSQIEGLNYQYGRYFRVTSTNGVPMSVYGYNYSSNTDATDSNALNDLNSYSRGTMTSRNTIIFLTPCADSTCIPPTITDVVPTYNSISISWNPGRDENSWKIEYREADSTTWLVADANYSGAPTYVISDLNSATKYRVRISSLCGGDLEGKRTITVSTLCRFSLPMFEDFENFTAPYSDPETQDCWDRASNTTYSYYPYNSDYSYYALSGSHAMYFTSYRDRLILPEMDATTDSLTIDLYAMCSYYSSYDGTPKLEVGVAVNPADTTTWIPLDTLALMGEDFEYLHFYTELDNYTGSTGRVYLRNIGMSSIYVDDLTVDKIPSCRDLTNVAVTNITSNTIEVAISDRFNRDNYTLLWSSMNDPAAAIDSVNVTTTTVTISGLTPATTYYVWARANCGGGDNSRLSSLGSISTNCDPIVVTEDATYLNDFEDVEMPCLWQTGSTGNTHWTNYANGDDYYITARAYSGGRMARAGNGTNGEAMLIMPTFDFSGMTSQAEVSFYYYTFVSGSSNGINEISVYYRTGVNGDWNLLSTLDTMNRNIWQKVYLPLPNSQGAALYQVAFKVNAQASSLGAFVDDVKVKGVTTCFAPESVTVSNITERTALVSWSGSAASYKVQYRPEGQWSWNARIADGVNSIIISPLDMSTNYEVRVVSLCTTYEQSDPGEVVHFTTEFCADRVEPVNYDASVVDTMTKNNFVNTSVNYAYNEVLVDAATLSTVSAGINGFAFYLDSMPGQATYSTCQIYMGHTSATTMSMFQYDSTFAKVYDGELHFGAGWNQIRLTAPFEWDGTRNVVIGIKTFNNNYYYNDTLYYSSHVVTDNKVYAGTSSDINFDPLEANMLPAGARSASNLVPDLKFFGCNPVCYEPVISRVTTTDNTVTVEWYNEGADIQVSIRSEAASDWDSPINVTGTNSYTFTNMPSMTDFEVRVRRDCSGVDEVYSDWVYGVARTDTACSIPTNLTVTNITDNSATFSWTDGAVAGNRWELHVWSDDLDNYYDVTTNPVNISGLVRGGNYQAVVRAYCASDNHVVGEWSEAVLFDNVCYPPTALTASLQSNGDVVLNWTPGERNTQWVVAYGYRGFFLNDQLGFMVVNTPTATISGLTDVSDPRAKSTDGTTYGFRVRAICSSEWNSDWNSEEVLVRISNVGIDDVNGNVDFTLHPNPASDRVTLVLGEFSGDATVSILSVDGRQMTHFVTVENRVSVDLKDYASGTYFVQVQTADGISVRKLVVR